MTLIEILGENLISPETRDALKNIFNTGALEPREIEMAVKNVPAFQTYRFDYDS